MLTYLAIIFRRTIIDQCNKIFKVASFCFSNIDVGEIFVDISTIGDTIFTSSIIQTPFKTVVTIIS